MSCFARASIPLLMSFAAAMAISGSARAADDYPAGVVETPRTRVQAEQPVDDFAPVTREPGEDKGPEAASGQPPPTVPAMPAPPAATEAHAPTPGDILARGKRLRTEPVVEKPATAPASAPAEAAAPAVGSPASGKPSRATGPAEKPSLFGTGPSPTNVAEERERAAKRDKDLDDTVADNHKLVAPLLAMHPGSNVVICMAGCSDRPAVVQVIPRKLAEVQTRSEMVPTSGPVTPGDEPADATPPTGDIICLAGCLDKPGQVVHRNVRLSWVSKKMAAALHATLSEIAGRLGNRTAVRTAVRSFVSPMALGYLAGTTATAEVRD